MKTAEIRKAFLEYFKQHQHTMVPGSSLIPANDPTLLFTNAGMVQFKDMFLGTAKVPYQPPRATSVQPCLRAGGKHNDLENVGYTARHHTFFEMLGNFSFGDYFKKEAIQFAWNFLTQILKLSPEKLWVTVYKDDKESEAIWLNEMKIDPKRFSRCGEKDNFWSMGETGPCGPCTEIFYDHGAHIAGGPPGSKDEDGDRYVEIWNLVFMQFNRGKDGLLTPLPKPCVDTGMGLERVTTVMQGVHNNYDIDLFQNLLTALSTLIQVADKTKPSMRVIVDHIRAVSFLILDGILPSNEGRGYVLRRIIRRAVRHGFQLGCKELFFYKLVPALVQEMGEAYPELKKAQKKIAETIQQEEQLFAQTLVQGMKMFDQRVADLKYKQISGDVVFQLYDTYGFPPDLTADIARERGLTIDEAGFDREMEAQRSRSQKSSHFQSAVQIPSGLSATKFLGYETLDTTAKVLAVIDTENAEKIVVLDQTPFYAESGGQIGDSGRFFSQHLEANVLDTQKQGDIFWHRVQFQKGMLAAGDTVQASVEGKRRQNIRLNHSATHLLHAALQKILGADVVQKGSLVDENRLRFDFSYPKALTKEQIFEIEDDVNTQIRADFLVEKREMPIAEAKALGAQALFGEKYGEQVRVVDMGNVSRELCGGTHVHRTGEIGLFRLTSESALASGVRRVEAATGEKALLWVREQERILQTAQDLLKTDRTQFFSRLTQVIQERQQFEKEWSVLKQELLKNCSSDFLSQGKEFQGVRILAIEVPEMSAGDLRVVLDELKSKLEKAVIVLASVKLEKIQLLAAVTKDITQRVSALDVLNYVCSQVNGKGGGRAELAQGGGSNIAALPAALSSVFEWVVQKLK